MLLRSGCHKEGGKRKPVQVALHFLELGARVGDLVEQKLFSGKVLVFKLKSSSFLLKNY